MATTNCGWCGALAAMEMVKGSLVSTGRMTTIEQRFAEVGWAMYQCPGCRSAVLAQGLVDRDDQWSIMGWYPTTPPVRQYPDSVPARIVTAAREAHSSLGVGNVQAAVLMARTTIEATAKAVGITSGSLVAKIEELYNQHLIYEHVRDAATEIRHVGNDAAHGDLVDDPLTAEEAGEVLELMDMVLDGVFIAPARTKAARLAREQKKAAKKAAASGGPAAGAVGPGVAPGTVVPGAAAGTP